MAYSLEMFDRLLWHSWTYIQASNGDRDWTDLSDNSENSEANEEPSITKSYSSTATNQSKLIVIPQASEEEMEISFTEEPRRTNQQHSCTSQMLINLKWIVS
ncbi:hypothetical protein RclHR1_35250002 [Rhizophagus clarus]|uniref:Uncharacterized protein n=1 Tax=Rhizophagus clarus TaxID=94130 RepID=A0A2Z6RSF5_9GLOM|nr:hypothetical protein RclHR1_35250002 [Rhizophagus clarus]